MSAGTDALRAELARAARALGGPADIEPLLERPRDPAFGDWATNVAMRSVALVVSDSNVSCSGVGAWSCSLPVHCTVLIWRPFAATAETPPGTATL